MLSFILATCQVSPDDFQKGLKKSKYIFQFECSRCDQNWWGGRSHNTCKSCRRTAKIRPFKDMVGVGWFVCDLCLRKFSGFAKGNVTSKCHRCNVEVTASFIIPGDNVSNKKENSNSHYCNVCRGVPPCPIVRDACSNVRRG